MAKEKKSMIGIDPLAWLKDDDDDVVENKTTATKEKANKKTTTKKTTVKNPSKDAAFTLQAIQDISTVADAHSELKALLGNDKVVIEAAQVERIDGASLQLLYSFIEEAKEKGVDVVWDSPSEALMNSAKLLGMVEALQINKAA